MNDFMEHLFILSKPVISIRSKFYVSTLLKRLGVEKVAHIPAAMDALNGGTEEGSFLKYRCDFFRYCRGENIKNPELIRDVDALLPGTYRLIRHPIWYLLSWHISNEDVLIALAQMVEPGLNQCILEYDEKTHNVFLRKFYARSFFGNKGKSLLQLLDRRGLDELAVLIIVMRACEIQGNHALTYFPRDRIVELLIGISCLKEFAPVFDCMRTQIRLIFTSATYYSIDNGENI